MGDSKSILDPPCCGTKPVTLRQSTPKGRGTLKTSTIILIGLLAIVIAFVAVVAARSKAGKGLKAESFRPRRPLTSREQSMFWRLVEACPAPEHVVLAQVSFGALLTAAKGTSAFRFTQKRADFVLVDKSFTVKAVIELDDASHAGNAERDADRDRMLQSAGYKVLRYPNIPEAAVLRRDLLGDRDQPATLPAASQRVSMGMRIDSPEAVARLRAEG